MLPKLLPILIGIVSLLIVSTPFISPSLWWVAVPLSYLIIPIVIIQISLLYFLLKRKQFIASTLSIFTLLIGGYSLEKMFVYSLSSDFKIVQQYVDGFSLLSYNTSFFRVGDVFADQYYSQDYNMSAINMKEWIRVQDADIIALQEFFDDTNSQIFNTVATISENGRYQYNFLHNAPHDNGVKRGIITFSKFPIVDYGEIYLSKNRYNGAHYTDVKIDTDTLRIINIHLESYSGYNSNNMLRFRSTIIERMNQVDRIISCINQSPYKVIVCGDFNSLPYSYIYRLFSKHLNNSFEIVGTGIGATYTFNNMPLIRIDNHFIAPSLELFHFQVDNDMKLSEHLPIKAGYILPD